MTTTLTVQRLVGGEIASHIPELAALRIRVFRDFPYLYDGTQAYEAEYLKHYADSPQSVMVIARDAGRIVGASTGMPMRDYGEGVEQPFLDHGYDTGRIFYFGESVLDAAYRGRGLGHRFFDEREAHARDFGYALACFCAVERPAGHPRRPADYQPLDAFWRKRGYRKHPELLTHFAWKDLDEAEESPKPLTFWLKSLQEAPGHGV